MIGTVSNTRTAMKRIIIANWKMQLSVARDVRLARVVRRRHRPADAQIILCPSFSALAAVAKILHGSRIALGAQNTATQERGKLTGEVSPRDLVALGCRYVIIGHSDRRALGETNAQIASKLRVSLRTGLKPILCVGEKLADRRRGRSLAVVRVQLRTAWQDLRPVDRRRILIAYEPVWAISPGGPIAPAQAFAMAEAIRRLTNTRRPLIYGGSVKPANVRAFLDGRHFRGALVGQASLTADSLLALARA